jgi:hypothetical protein
MVLVNTEMIPIAYSALVNGDKYDDDDDDDVM